MSTPSNGSVDDTKIHKAHLLRERKRSQLDFVSVEMSTLEQLADEPNPSAKPEQLQDATIAARSDDLDGVYAIKKVQGYRKSTWRIVIYYILCIATLGALPLFARWVPWLKTWLTHYKSSIRDAQTLLIQAKVSETITPVHVREVDLSDYDGYTSFKMFTYRNANYIYDVQSNRFRPANFDVFRTPAQIHKYFGQGIDDTTRSVRRVMFGKNLIHVPVKHWFLLLIDEVLNPFYFFQIFSIIVWMIDHYWVYASTIFIMSAISAITALRETRRNLIKLHNLATHICEVTRINNQGIAETVSSVELVPGDIIEIPTGFVPPCDIALLTGQCVVNESMLTGESVPVMKAPLDPRNDQDLYNPQTNKNNTLFSGTKVIQTRLYGGSKVTGLVVRTGFNTAKGMLVNSILYPKPNQFRFYNDSFKFIGIMFVIGAIGFTFSAFALYRLRVAIGEIVLRALDVITITVPPALPMAMTAGTAFAIARLSKRKIYCISPPSINVAGQVQMMCFDKTGTLTQDGLDLMGILPASEKKFNELVKTGDEIEALSKSNPNLFHTLVCCHSLTRMNDKLIGDPLEIKIFEATNWEIVDQYSHDYKHEITIPTILRGPVKNKDEKPEKLGIVREFDFNSALQRMSVISKNLKTGQHCVYTKGSPEMLKKLCKSSTIPEQFSEKVYLYAHDGYRVLACGYKTLSDEDVNNISKISREEVEKDLIFGGFIIMQNTLKSDTTQVIKILKDANVRNVMVTGDNPYTAISVARKCGLTEPNVPCFLGELKSDADGEFIKWKDVDSDLTLDPNTLLPTAGRVENYEIAVTGDAFEYLMADKSNSQVVLNMLVTASVYARMSPSQKMRLIEELQKIKYFTGMCGDGANDCGALKQAHIGISLSEAEASIAAPFTYQRQSIDCVPIVMREGRAALATSFSMFKYMMSYSFIQFMSVIILYHVNSNFGDYMFLWQDMAIIVPIAALMGNTGANTQLVNKRPPQSLISRTVLVSLFGNLFLAMVFQLIVWFDLHAQPWFIPGQPGVIRKKCFESTAIFLMSAFQTYNVALAYSISKPFKKPLYTNKSYTIVLVILFILSSYLVLYPDYYIRWFIELVDLPIVFRFRLYGYCILHLVICWLFERFVIVGVGKFHLDSIRIKKKRELYDEILEKFSKTQSSNKSV